MQEANFLPVCWLQPSRWDASLEGGDCNTR
jgi:hypothetical protein